MAGGRVSVGRVGEAACVRLRCSADGLVGSSTGVGSRTVAMGCEVEMGRRADGTAANCIGAPGRIPARLMAGEPRAGRRHCDSGLKVWQAELVDSVGPAGEHRLSDQWRRQVWARRVGRGGGGRWWKQYMWGPRSDQAARREDSVRCLGGQCRPASGGRKLSSETGGLNLVSLSARGTGGEGIFGLVFLSG